MPSMGVSAKMHINIYQIIGIVFLLAVSYTVLLQGTRMLSNKSDSTGFPGPRWHHPGETIEARELLNAKFARVESHTLQTSTGDIIKGWIWVDFHDRVDILVEDERGSFLLYEQDNYGLPKRSMAVLSSRIQPSETPLQAARRAMSSYMGRRSEQWTFLGRFRTDANRGGGFVYCYLARNSEAELEQTPSSLKIIESKSMIKLSRKQLQDAVVSGKFLEAKWALTVSLGLLRINLDIWVAVAPDGMGDFSVDGMEEAMADPAVGSDKSQPAAAGADAQKHNWAGSAGKGPAVSVGGGIEKPPAAVENRRRDSGWPRL